MGCRNPFPVSRLQQRCNGAALALVFAGSVSPAGALLADDEPSDFGFGMKVSVSWLLKINSATVNGVRENTSAAAAGVADGDAIIAIADCAIPGCSTSRAEQLMAIDADQTRRFTLKRADGSIYTVDLPAVSSHQSPVTSHGDRP